MWSVNTGLLLQTLLHAGYKETLTKKATYIFLLANLFKNSFNPFYIQICVAKKVVQYRKKIYFIYAPTHTNYTRIFHFTQLSIPIICILYVHLSVHRNLLVYIDRQIDRYNNISCYPSLNVNYSVGERRTEKSSVFEPIQVPYVTNSYIVDHTRKLATGLCRPTSCRQTCTHV